MNGSFLNVGLQIPTVSQPPQMSPISREMHSGRSISPKAMVASVSSGWKRPPEPVSKSVEEWRCGARRSLQAYKHAPSVEARQAEVKACCVPERTR